VPFNWKDLTPVSMLGARRVRLWVNAESPYKTTQEYVAALKSGDNGKFRMAARAASREDQIITVALEKAVGKADRAVQGAAATWPCSSSASTWIRRSTTRSRRSRTGAPARCARCRVIRQQADTVPAE
jgi:tripartite-type tricarboxylate transporter receptor subunit TctC